MSAASGEPLPSTLSQRAQSRLLHELAPARYDIPGKRYDRELHPEGVINMATAENSLMTTELLQYMHNHVKFLTPDHLKCRVAITNGVVNSTANMLPVYINEYAHPIIPVTEEHCVPGPGISALFAQVVWALCDDGDGVLIATPYYADYVRDIVYPARAKLVAAPIPQEIDPLAPECITYLEDAIERSSAAGTPIRVLVLCNPHNPLARAYPLDTVKAYAKIYNLHLLVDEVYANQVFSSSLVPDPTPFVSALSLDMRTECGCDPSRIHVLAGPTKDFGASGFKIGAFVSQHNPKLVKIVQGALGGIPISSAADALLTPVLRDDAFRVWFLQENRKRLGQAFENVAAWCLFHDIP
ncbi:hypothetical protein PLICRDRAFT_179782 [Plicaturopsis crispa FD-325 SS-3]|uniref:Aminotransferase class I/classII large domain-containing protein n=1 Tax=Plicaturopsis crispa FD-325 SS-3 TaxID=944288 RepID=A0A0C9SX21_PLICR|nr:hypothetical protein PLICRDRAFT_179782 [Plicaturopsis crispa FD-325 SS-3]